MAYVNRGYSIYVGHYLCCYCQGRLTSTAAVAQFFQAEGHPTGQQQRCAPINRNLGGVRRWGARRGAACAGLLRYCWHGSEQANDQRASEGR